MRRQRSPQTSRLQKPPKNDAFELVLAFLNTGGAGAEEAWSDAKALGHWLEEHGLLPATAKLDTEDLERARAARRGIRLLIAVNSGHGLDEDGRVALDELAAGTSCRVRIGKGGEPRFEPGSEDLDGALGRILGSFTLLRQDERWERIKLCADPQCRRAFFDASNNRAGKWCGSGRCGNRINARNYRRRYQRRHGKMPRGGRMPGYK